MTWTLRDDRDLLHGEVEVTKQGRLEFHLHPIVAGLDQAASIELAREVLQRSTEWLVVLREDWDEIRRLMEEMEDDQ